MKLRTVMSVTAASAASLLIVSGCGSSAEEPVETSSGFAYGAAQSEVDAAIESLDPLTIKYQPSGASPNATTSQEALDFAEYVSERSGGKITVEIIWGQAVAGYSEVDDALVDGRLDIAYNVPIYQPNKYPAFTAATVAAAGLPNSPFLGEVISSAVAVDIGWKNSQLLEEYSDSGIIPMSPQSNSGGYYMFCRDEGTAPDDWAGRQVRIGSTSHMSLIESIGGSPVSMEYVEVYEALQRGTVDCTVLGLSAAANGGLLEVAPHVSYTDDASSFSSRLVSATHLGPHMADLPLAYQQIIFDAISPQFSAWVEGIANGNKFGVEEAKSQGGTLNQIDSATADIIVDANERLRQELIDSGEIDPDLVAEMDESIEKWTAKAEELGIEDPGEFEDMDEWWEPGVVDLTEFAEAVFLEVYEPHRPA